MRSSARLTHRTHSGFTKDQHHEPIQRQLRNLHPRRPSAGGPASQTARGHGLDWQDLLPAVRDELRISPRPPEAPRDDQQLLHQRNLRARGFQSPAALLPGEGMLGLRREPDLHCSRDLKSRSDSHSDQPQRHLNRASVHCKKLRHLCAAFPSFRVLPLGRMAQ